MDKKRAKLVFVIGGLNILVSTPLLLLSCFNVIRLIIEIFASGKEYGRFSASVLTTFLFLNLLLIPFSVFWIIVGLGLIRFKSWARMFTIIGPLLPLPFVLTGAAFGYVRLVLILLFFFYLFYFTRPSVKEQFEGAATGKSREREKKCYR